jgi:CDP-diacylglycerol---glycerol-3-phosphate 3-phosphatidyltransferase
MPSTGRVGLLHAPYVGRRMGRRPSPGELGPVLERHSHRIPNLVIATRVALAFVAAGLLFTGPAAAAAVGVALVVVVIAMDALDGIAARRLGVASKLGGILDITADRIVEHVFWITFAVAHQVALWVPLVVVTRSFLVDAARGLAHAQGRTAFGNETMARSRLARFLTSSRTMRNAYGGAKVAAFVLLGLLVVAERRGEQWSALDSTAGASVLAAVGLCLLRGIPVLVDARAYLCGTQEGAH